MSASPSGSGSVPNDDGLDDLEGLGDADPSGKAASDPEAARQEAEDALAEIEALADLDEDPGGDDEPGATGAEATASEPTSEAAASGEESGAEARSEQATGASRTTASDTPEDQCENCGALLDGPYCSQCGQKAADRIVPIWHMINEALEAVFELDVRVLRTLPKFLFLPGRLTKEYINGRRKRYIRPFRLYLFSTFLLFAVIALTTTGNFGFVLDPQGMARFNPPNTALAASNPSDAAALQDQNGSLFGDPEQRKRMAEEFRSDSTSINVTLYDDPEANKNLERLLRAKVAQAIEDPWAAVSSAIDRGPYLMFLLLPIFAFLLKLFYVRRGRLYVEHLIFSLHVHALAFFAFTAGLLLEQSSIGWVSGVAPWVEASPLLYLILAMSHVYEQGLIKSSLKAFLLLSIYGIIFAIGLLALFFVAVLFL